MSSAAVAAIDQTGSTREANERQDHKCQWLFRRLLKQNPTICRPTHDAIIWNARYSMQYSIQSFNHKSAMNKYDLMPGGSQSKCFTPAMMEMVFPKQTFIKYYTSPLGGYINCDVFFGWITIIIGITIIKKLPPLGRAAVPSPQYHFLELLITIAQAPHPRVHLSRA